MDLKCSRYPGNVMFAGVCVFNVGTRMGTIKNKMAEGFLETLETLTHTRKPSCSDLRLPSVSIDGTLVGLQLY